MAERAVSTGSVFLRLVAVSSVPLCGVGSVVAIALGTAITTRQLNGFGCGKISMRVAKTRAAQEVMCCPEMLKTIRGFSNSWSDVPKVRGVDRQQRLPAQFH